MAQVTLRGNPFSTSGELPAVGSSAPGFSLVGSDLSEITADSLSFTKSAPNVAVAGVGIDLVVRGRRESRGGRHGTGGRIDAGETPQQAALRELSEEINLSLDASHIIGTLDDYQTRSGFLITPVVVWADVECATLVPNPHEVASIHAFTFTELNRTDSPHLESIPQSDQQVLSMHYVKTRIYAPTAAFLYQFREVAICGRPTRVDHFDQPVFAWR